MKRFTKEEVKQKCEGLDSDFEIIDFMNYQDLNSPIKFVHKKCGHELLISPSNFIHNNTRCIYCMKNHKKSTQEVKDIMFEMYGDKYTLLSEYTGSNNMITVKHNVCGRVYDVKAKSFLDDRRQCEYCFGNTMRIRKAKEIFKETISQNFELLDESFITMEQTCKVKNKSTNEIFETIPKYFLSSNFVFRCDKKTTYLGEIRIKTFLDDKKIQYEEQVYFKDCRSHPTEYYKNGRVLIFDFKLIIDGQMYLIEYDGIQHFKPIRGIEKLKSQQENDLIKNEYCKNKNINLIRITYEQYNEIESILEKLIYK